ncbi:hypothetical protein JCM6882_009457 [Rhodosporidiobolus microsporus]
MSLSPLPSLVLVRTDTPSSPTSTRTFSTFTQEGTGVVLFNAQHAFNADTNEYSSTLYSGRDYRGTVSLDYINVGSQEATKADKFYRLQGWFSKRRLFKLGQSGIWASWDNEREDGAMQLVDVKSKAVLARIVPVETAPESLLPFKTRLTFSPALTAVLCPPSPASSSTSLSSPLSTPSSLFPSAPVPSITLPLVLIVLTWLHQDYFRLEERRVAAEKEREKEDEKDPANRAF